MHSRVTLSAFVSVSHSHFCCLGAQQIQLPVPKRAAASSNASKLGGGEGKCGAYGFSFAGIIKLFLFYTFISCWCQGLHHLLVSKAKDLTATREDFCHHIPSHRKEVLQACLSHFWCSGLPGGSRSPSPCQTTARDPCDSTCCTGEEPIANTPQNVLGDTAVPCNEGTMMPKRWTCCEIPKWSQGRHHQRRVGR